MMAQQTTATKLTANEARNAIRRFAYQPSYLLTGEKTSFTFQGVSTGTDFLHIYPAIHNSVLGLIILAADEDQSTLPEQLDFWPCTLVPGSEAGDPSKASGVANDHAPLSRRSASVPPGIVDKRIEQWADYRFMWFDQTGPYQCVVFPTRKLTSGTAYSILFSLSGPVWQLAGDLIMEANMATATTVAYNTVQLIPPLGEHQPLKLDSFALFKRAMAPRIILNLSSLPPTITETETGAIVVSPTLACHVSNPFIDVPSLPGFDNHTVQPPSPNLVCVFVSADAQLYEVVSPDGGDTWSSPVLMHGGGSFGSPALACSQSTTFCAFTDNSYRVYLMHRPHGLPLNWSAPTLIEIAGGVVDAVGVTLCMTSWILYGMYTDRDDKVHLIEYDTENPVAGWKFSSNQPGIQSSHAPALTFLGSDLYCVFVGNYTGKENQLFFTRETSPGGEWSEPTPIASDLVNNSTAAQPSLTVRNDTLYCAFLSSGGNQLRIVQSYDRGQNWSVNHFMTNTGSSVSGPALAATPTNLYGVNYRDNDSLVLTTSVNGFTWGGRNSEQETV